MTRDVPDVRAPGARAISADLLERLRRHYIKPSQPLPGGVFVPEVGWNGGGPTRADALFVGFTSSSGRLLVGHEIKATRSDWLAELGKPGKADPWADQCHEWWLVSVPGVVAPSELPEGWGLMYPGKSVTRMRVVTPARRHPDRVPSWDAVRSLIARQDTLRAAAVSAAQQDALAAARKDIEERVEARVAQVRRADENDAAMVAKLREQVEQYERALGARITPSGRSYMLEGITEEQLADLVKLIRTHGSLQHATRALASRFATLTHLQRDVTELNGRIRQALANVGDSPGQSDHADLWDGGPL